MRSRRSGSRVAEVPRGRARGAVPRGQALRGVLTLDGAVGIGRPPRAGPEGSAGESGGSERSYPRRNRCAQEPDPVGCPSSRKPLCAAAERPCATARGRETRKRIRLCAAAERPCATARGHETRKRIRLCAAAERPCATARPFVRDRGAQDRADFARATHPAPANGSRRVMPASGRPNSGAGASRPSSSSMGGPDRPRSTRCAHPRPRRRSRTGLRTAMRLPPRSSSPFPKPRHFLASERVPRVSAPRARTAALNALTSDGRRQLSPARAHRGLDGIEIPTRETSAPRARAAAVDLR